ncbi:DUF4215 domain-containing protein [Myxococcota bacterium]|nr:DUF4215 domain-containing protein [Myxococcota bacterium]
MTTAEDGSFTWAGDQPARIRVFPQGTNVNVINASGFTASVAFSLESGGRYTWNDRSAELRDAQVTTYVASRRAIEHGKTIAPAMRWLSTNRLAATVNIDDVCNAFSDGDTINFFRSGQGCENTGRLPDVIYHEFGHAFHYHALIPGAGNFDTALSEGASDYYAASITGDPATARGFFFDDQPLRDIDPVGTEARWPDGISFDPHETGLIFAGAMWDLRKALIAELGTEAGIAKTHEIFLGVLARATDIPSSFGEALASADDDGDLSNGTPNYCAIYEAFARHGLAETGINPPMTWDNNIYLGVPDGVTCPGAAIASARIHWEIRGEPGSGGTVDMELVGTEWTTRLPDDRKNVVLRFQMELTLGDGSIARFPQNAADPRYEMYVGAVTPLYCTDFETDPLAEGWAHGPLGGAPAEGDDWELGTPRAVFGSGDPNAARSGTQVMGNDLGSGDNDGRYARGASSALTSPVISTNGYSIVRLQYWRWLNVEDSQSDQARIVGNGQPLWTNASAGNPQAPLNHLDSEWVFHDVDLSPVVADDQVQVAFELTANMRRRFGGWTIDDVCVVGVTVCGNGAVEPGETCDDGNLTDGDGCEASCAPTPPAVCGNGRVEQGESCDDGNLTDGDGCQASCTPTPAPVCGNGVVEQGEACDDGVLDGTACAAGCVAVLETDDGGCGCTTSTHATSRSSLALFGLFALLGLARARRR